MNTFPGSHFSALCEAHLRFILALIIQNTTSKDLGTSQISHLNLIECSQATTHTHARPHTSPHFSLACVLEVPACMMYQLHQLFNIISTCLISGEYLNGAACEQK